MNKLRELIDSLISDETVSESVKTQLSLILDTLVEIETENREYETNRDEAVERANQIADENKRLREYNPKLIMKIGSGFVSEPRKDDETKKDDEDKVTETFEKIVEDYKM